MSARPFLKWVGGKGALLETLAGMLPAEFGTYMEPFLGGGAMFYSLAAAGKLKAAKRVVLSDVNEELIWSYKMVRDRVEDVVKRLDEHDQAWTAGGDEYYYSVREQMPRSLTEEQRAARMIFLNKTGYNGLYRVNDKGRFNVPPGKFKNRPTVCDRDNLRACSEALRGTMLDVVTYQAVLTHAEEGDFVYMDPPYLPVSKTSSFTAYTAGEFSLLDHKKLAETYSRLTDRGVKVMLSNSSHPKVKALYSKFEVRTVTAPRSINTHYEKRGDVEEIVVLNYKPPEPPSS